MSDSPASMATLGMSDQEKEAVERLRRDVIEPSMKKLVLLDFWADWCEPCKQLGPVIEAVAADYASKGVVLVKIDVEADKIIAAQFQIRSIPTVYAFFQGQPVADLTAYRTDGQLRRVLDQLLAQLPVESDAKDLAAELEPLIEEGQALLDSGNSAAAEPIFADIVARDPANPVALGGLARAMIAAGRTEEAHALLDSLDAEIAATAPIGRARAALDVMAAPATDTSAEEARLSANPDDHEARFAIANAKMAAGDRDGAAEALLDIIARDKDWNEAAAKARLLQLLEAAGFEDPWGRGVRRRLSALLFT